MSKLINRLEAARILGYSERSAYAVSNFIKKNGVREVRIGVKIVRYFEDDILKLASLKNNVVQDDFINADEAAKILTISKPMVYSLASQGEIPSHKSGCNVLFKKSELTDYLISITRGNTPVDPRESIEERVDDRAVEDQPETTNSQEMFGDPAKEYKTGDLWEAAILSANGYELDSIRPNANGKSCMWIFEESDGMRELLANHYHGQLTMNTRLLRDHFRNLKSKINHSQI